MTISIGAGITIGAGISIIAAGGGGGGGPNIGDAYQGGYYAGDISTTGNGVANFRLVVAPAATGQNSAIRWKETESATPGTQSDIDGPTNSANMNNSDHPAAQFCEGLTIGGFSDWYMPAKNELEVLYYNLKPSTTSNLTSSGINPNSVPPRGSNYSAGVPDQTSATDFRSPSGAQAFTPGYYWTSTELSTFTTWARAQGFGNGEQNSGTKRTLLAVRAVRRVAV